MCDCLEKIDKKLMQTGKGFKIKRAYGVSDEELSLTVHIPIPTEMLEPTESGKTKDGPMIMATYCPFCGVEWSKPSTKRNQIV